MPGGTRTVELVELELWTGWRPRRWRFDSLAELRGALKVIPDRRLARGCVHVVSRHAGAVIVDPRFARDSWDAFVQTVGADQ